MNDRTPNHDLTRIAILLDRSGSMTSVQDATMDGFNEFIRQQKELEGDVDVLLVQFDDQFEISFDLPIAEVPLLNRETFVPRGSTALYDAQSRALSMLNRQLASLPETNRHTKVVVVTLTDGQENASKLSNLNQVAESIRNHREHDRWEFIFLGARQDALATGVAMNIPERSCMTYAAIPAAIASVMKSTSRQVTMFRQGAPPAFTDSDRRDAMTEKKTASA